MSILLNRQCSLPNLRVSKQDSSEECFAQSTPYATPTVELGEFFNLILREYPSERRGRGSSEEATEDDTGVISFDDVHDLKEGDISSAMDNLKENSSDEKNGSSVTKVVQLEGEPTDLDISCEGDSITEVTSKESPTVIQPQRSHIIGNKAWGQLAHVASMKDYKKRKSRVQGAKKKWKVCELSLGFQFSLLPRREPVTDCGCCDDMEKELERFEMDCVQDARNDGLDPSASGNSLEEDSKDKNSEQDRDEAINNDLVHGNHSPLETGLAVSIAGKANFGQSSKKHRENSLDDDFEYTYLDWVWFYESKVTTQRVDVLVTVQEDKRITHLRSKKKWKVQKAHKQVKSKHCTTVHNGGHGKKLYIKHVVIAAMKLELGCLFRRNVGLSMKRIDKEKGKIKAQIKEVRNTGKALPQSTVSYAGGKTVYTVSRKNEKALGHTLDVYNFDGSFAADLVNALQSVQYRDLTPEDYDLLLRLDERVKQKTIDQATLDGLRSDHVTEETAGEICMVCLDPYSLGERRKFLPCDHVFHAQCIDMWLTNNSVTCPLDGTEVVPS